MLIAEFTSRIPNMGDTKTVEDWKKYIGEKPYRMGVIARMYPNNTLSYLTDGLRNIFYNDEKASKYQVSDSMVIEWQIENNQIKHVEFVAEPEGTGTNGEDITIFVAENYFQKYDIIRIDETKQQLIVVAHPIRKNDNCWALTTRLISNNFDTMLDAEGCEPGKTCTFQSTANVELSEEGYSKFQSSFEKRRNYMTTFRHDVSWSSLYAIQEPVFMRICDDKDKNKGEGVYKMLKKEKELLETFQYSVSTGLLLNKGNITKEGRATITDPDTGRPIYIGEGLIPQIEQAANKFTYTNKPTVALLNMIMDKMAEKSQDDTGNHYMFVVNRKLWSDMNLVLSSYLADRRTDGAYMYSKSANKGAGGYIKVGATFDTYEFAGNTVSFAVDRALSREYPTKGYGICLDLTADKTSGTPAIAKFALTGKDCIINTIEGVGGADGKTSGKVSTNVAGSKMVMHTYAAIAAFTPFRSAMIYEV